MYAPEQNACYSARVCMSQDAAAYIEIDYVLVSNNKNNFNSSSAKPRPAAPFHLL